MAENGNAVRLRLADRSGIVAPLRLLAMHLGLVQRAARVEDAPTAAHHLQRVGHARGQDSEGGLPERHLLDLRLQSQVKVDQLLAAREGIDARTTPLAQQRPLLMAHPVQRHLQPGEDRAILLPQELALRDAPDAYQPRVGTGEEVQMLRFKADVVHDLMLDPERTVMVVPAAEIARVPQARQRAAARPVDRIEERFAVASAVVVPEQITAPATHPDAVVHVRQDLDGRERRRPPFLSRRDSEPYPPRRCYGARRQPGQNRTSRAVWRQLHLRRKADRFAAGGPFLDPESDLALLDLGCFDPQRRQIDRRPHQRLFRPLHAARDF